LRRQRHSLALAERAPRRTEQCLDAERRVGGDLFGKVDGEIKLLAWWRHDLHHAIGFIGAPVLAG
jgi:hypothetical protein